MKLLNLYQEEDSAHNDVPPRINYELRQTMIMLLLGGAIIVTSDDEPPLGERLAIKHNSHDTLHASGNRVARSPGFARSARVL